MYIHIFFVAFFISLVNYFPSTFLEQRSAVILCNYVLHIYLYTVFSFERLMYVVNWLARARSLNTLVCHFTLIHFLWDKNNLNFNRRKTCHPLVSLTSKPYMCKYMVVYTSSIYLYILLVHVYEWVYKRIYTYTWK